MVRPWPPCRNRGVARAQGSLMAFTLLHALENVAFGDISSVAFMSATQAGRPVDAPGPLAVRSASQERLKEAWAAHEGRFIWEGPIPDSEKPGTFFVLNPYQTQKLTSHDRRDLLNGSGLTADAIGEISGIFVEVDEALDGGRLAIIEQAKIYDQIEAETGLRFTTAVLSGDHRPSALEHIKPWQTLEVGKSLHVVIATRWQGAGPEARRLRQEATDALCAIAGADPLVRDLARKMRLGGVIAKRDCTVRVQTCIRADPSSVFDLQDVRDRLVAYADRLGIDVAQRLMVMTTAFQCRQKARAWIKAADQGLASRTEADEAAETLMDLALEIRRGGEVTPSHRRLIGFVGTPKGQIGVTTQSGETRVISTGHADGWDASTTVLTHTSGREGTASSLWADLKRGYRVPDVHCIGHADAHASAFLTEWNGTFTINCPSCGKIRSGSAQTQVTRTSGLIDLIENDTDDIVIVEAVSPRPLQYEVRGMNAEERAAHTSEWIRRRDEAQAAYAARPQTIALKLHETFLASAPEVLELVADEVRLEDSVYQLAGLEADLLGESSECPVYSHREDNGNRPDILPAHLMDLARERFEEVAQTCKRGPLACTPMPEGRLRMQRLACRARVCPECGPRGRRAERAAISASIAALGVDWRVAQMIEMCDERQLRRWDEGGTDRVVLTIILSPSDSVALLAWAPGHEPSTRTRRRLGDDHTPKVWADEISELIKDDVHPGEKVRAVQGTSWLTRQINAIKKELLQIKKKENVVKKCFITKAKSSEARARVMDEIEGHAHLVSESGSVRTRLGEIAEIGVDIGGARYRLATMGELLSACRRAKIFRGQAHRSTRSDDDILEDILSNFDLDLDDEDPASKKGTAS